MKPVLQALVTGAQGFLGRHLVRHLKDSGTRVTALARRPPSEVPYIAMGEAPWCASRLARIIEITKPDVIFHLVGGAVGSRAQLEQLNVGVANTIMQALREVRMRPLLVCCGSAAEYGTSIIDGMPVRESATCMPVGVYGTTKLAQTNAALEFAKATATPVLIARIFNPIGPGMPPYLALGDFARQIALMRGSGGVLQTGDIDVCRDFIDVRHVVKALITLAQNPRARGVVNICTGQATDLRTLVEILINVSTKKVTIETSSARLRVRELAVVIGSIARLAQLGAAPPPTNFEDVVASVWRDAELRWTSSS